MNWQRSAVGVAAGLLVAAVAVPAVATHDPAMGVFVDESSRVPFPPDANIIATDVEMIDFDLDGDLDLFVARGDLAGGDSTNLVFQNNGTGTFTRVSLVNGSRSDFTDVHFGDANGDGRLDAVVSTNLDIERLLLWNTTRGRWIDRTSRSMPAAQPADVTIESQFFDADGDGDQDVITAVEDPFVPPGAQSRLYLNSGTARFTDVTATNLPVFLDDSSAIGIGDFDADGDADVIVVNNGPFRYLANDGTGHFVDETSTHLPIQPSNRDSGRDAVVADLDTDGDLDVMFAISRSDLGPVLWLNDGAGHFTDVSNSNVPLATFGAQDLEACDLEGDGDLDIVEANTGTILSPPTDHRFTGAQDRVLVNDGAGLFTDVTAEHLPSVIDSSFSVACGDITGDGRADLVVANGKGETLRVYVQT